MEGPKTHTQKIRLLRELPYGIQHKLSTWLLVPVSIVLSVQFASSNSISNDSTVFQSDICKRSFLTRCGMVPATSLILNCATPFMAGRTFQSAVHKWCMHVSNVSKPKPMKAEPAPTIHNETKKSIPDRNCSKACRSSDPNSGE